MMTAPLSGIKVIDLCRYLPGPHCCALLADYGADVIRVEQPREVAKKTKMQGGEGLDAEADRRFRWMDVAGRNKRSVMIDFSTPAGRDAVLRLSADADVFVHDYRKPVIEAAGLDHETLLTANPRIVYAEFSASGASGPYAGLPGHDPIALALAGGMTRTGEDENDPRLIGIPAVDVSAGAHGAFAVLAALMGRGATGKGAYLDIAMSDCALPLMTSVMQRYMRTGSVPPTRYQLGDSNVFETRDGKHVVATNMEFPFWKRFCEGVGRADLVDRFSEPTQRDALVAELRDIYRSRDRDDWFQFALENDLQIGPVLQVDEALRSPHHKARGNIHDLGDGVYTFGPPIKIAPDQTAPPRPAPIPGEHTFDILSKAGFSADEISDISGETMNSGVSVNG